MIRKIFYITLLCVLYLGKSYSQNKKSILKTLIGDKVENSIGIMPLGMHTTGHEHGVDFFGTYYLSYTHNGFEGFVFKNSYRDWTTGIVYKRGWFFTENLYAQYGLGIAYGYKGRLSKVQGIPLKNTFLFNGDFNLIGGLDVGYKITDKLAFNTIITPLVFIYGIRYYL
ncbi:MAG: hypothetical protein ACPGUU_03200 [Flavobacteriaceae bacterium]